MLKTDIKRSILKGIVSSILPFVMFYFFFVTIKIVCVDTLRFNNVSLFIYIFYMGLVTYMLVNYVRIINDNKVTTFARFPFTYHDIYHDKRIHVGMAFKEQVIDKQIKNKNVCFRCLVYKPDRATHCKECKRCFLKRISHCYFLETCIGFHNQKFFILFLVSLILQTLFILIAFFIIWHIIDFDTKRVVLRNTNKSVSQARLIFKYHYIISIVAAFILLPICIYFFILHIYLVLRNETDLERKALNLYRMQDSSLDYVFSKGLIRLNTPNMSRNIANPYFLGLYTSFKEVFGDNLLEWLLPTFSTKGNGTEFELNYAEDEYKSKTLIPDISDQYVTEI